MRTLGNRLVAAVLRSRLNRPLSRSVMLLTVRGRRSGEPHTFPVQYAREAETVYVYPAHHERKLWWRNLLAPAPVEMLIEGRRTTGTGQALLAESSPQEVAAGTRAYLARFPKLARVVGGEMIVRIRAQA